MDWERRSSLPDRPGVYLIARANAVDPIYIGETLGRGGLVSRMRQFHRSATTGKPGHAGGVTFHSLFGANVADLVLSAHVAPSSEDKAKVAAFILFFERKLIWEYVLRNGRLPLCNLA